MRRRSSPRMKVRGMIRPPYEYKNLTIGLDLGDRRHHACVLDEPGEILTAEVIVNTREVLTAFSARYPGATMVMETGTHSPWGSRLMTVLGHPVIVANAR